MEYTPKIREELVDKLEQITESIDVIIERIHGVESVDSLLNTPWGMTTLDSCVMRLQVIGELVRTIENQTNGELFSLFPAIPWKSIIGLRNIISHEYANIDYDVIWEIFRKHLLLLSAEIVKIKTMLLQ